MSNKKVNKNSIEEGYEDLKNLLEEAKKNATAVLASSMQEEIDQIVKESLSTEDSEEIEELEEISEGEESMDNEEVEDITEYEESASVEPVDESTEVVEVNEEELIDFLDSDEDSEEEDTEEDVVVDLRNSSDEEVSEAYENMDDLDELSIEDSESGQDDELDVDIDNLDLEESDEGDFEFDEDAINEMISQLEESDEKEPESAEVLDVIGGDEDSESEIEESTADRYLPKKNKKVKPEIARQLRGESVKEINRLKEAKNTLIKELNALKEEKAKSDAKIKSLSEAGDKYKKLLETYKGEMEKMLVFNSNLAYVNRLFVENTTTNKEKASIIQKFDKSESLDESKKLYESLSVDLKSRQNISDKIDNKLNQIKEQGSVKKLHESTAYEDPAIEKMKRFINYQ